MKRCFIGLTALCLLLGLLAGCGASPASRDDRVILLASIYPLYDWAKNVVGDETDRVDIRLLIDSGMEAHSFQPGVGDVAAIADCDILLYVGGESDRWIADALGQKATDPSVIRLADRLADRLHQEEIVDGMQGEADDGFDEHLWLSLRNAVSAVEAIADVLAARDADHADVYRRNAAAYEGDLTALDAAYAEAVSAAPRKTLLFADRFPFRYLTEDYGLSYYAAFPGCSTEATADFKTVVALADALTAEQLKTVLILENGSTALADTVIQTAGASNVAVLRLNSLQSIPADQIRAGADYISLMRSNLDVLKRALQ